MMVLSHGQIALFGGAHLHGRRPRKLQKFLQRAGNQGVMAVDKNRGDVRLGFGDLVNTDGVVPPDRTDEALGQQSDAEAGADRAINRLDIAEFERPNAHYAALNQDIFEYLTVRASLRVNNDFDITLAGQIIETS